MKKLIILFISAIVVFASCTEEFDTNYEGFTTRQLVVDGGISTDTIAHEIRLTRTMDYTDTIVPVVENARVSIDNGEELFPLNEEEPGVYRTASDVYGEIGKTYTLHIELEDGTIYSGSDIIPFIEEIDSIQPLSYYHEFIEDTINTILFFGQEASTPNNFYRWNLLVNDTMVTDTLGEVRIDADDWVQGVQIEYMEVYSSFDLEELEDLNMYTNKFELELVSLSEPYFDFLMALMLETQWRGGPFDATPADLPTNIEGARGFFYAVSKARSTYLPPSQ
jgi:hypothetical protein